MGGRIKKGAIRNLVQKENVDFICIQETKLESIDFSLCKILWGGEEVGWMFKESIGSPGGLLCMWNKAVLSMEVCYQGRGFICVKGRWGDQRIPCSIFNIYGPCDPYGRRCMWEELRILRQSNNNIP